MDSIDLRPVHFNTMTSGENRTHPRLTIRHTGIRNSLLRGHVLNLSLGGLGFETASALRIGSRQHYRVEVGEKRFDVEGEIRWCRLVRTVGNGKGEVVPIFRAGLAFGQPLQLFSQRGLQNSGEWFDPEFRVSR